jgi:hypothetical protein
MPVILATHRSGGSWFKARLSKQFTRLSGKKKPITKKWGTEGTGGVAQVVGAEFKLQYH